MKKTFKPYLTLDQLYVSPIVQMEDGGYKCLSFSEMRQVEMPQTGSRLMDAVASTLATVPCHSCKAVAKYLDVDLEKLSGAVYLNCGLGLKDLLVEYRIRLICELIQHTQFSVDEIAKRSGVASNSVVCHLLKRRCKTTFADYRRQFQGTIITKKIFYKGV